MPPTDIFALELLYCFFQKKRLKAGFEVRKPNTLIKDLID